MLIKHHTDRLNSILSLKKRETQIYETEFLILRYQQYCFKSETSDKN